MDEILLKNIKGNVLKSISLLIDMIKKSIGTQIAILLALAIGIATFLIKDFNTPYLWINLYMKTAQPYLIAISILLFIPPIVNLISSMVTDLDSKEYDEKPFYKGLRVVAHTCVILLYILNLSWIGTFILLQLIRINVVWLSMALTTLVIYSIMLIVSRIVKKRYKFAWYNPLIWIK